MEEVSVGEIRCYSYLGVIISEDRNDEAEINRRTSLGKKGCFALTTIFRSSDFQRQTKIHIYKTLMRSILY